MSIKYLIKVATGGAFLCLGTGWFLGGKIEDNLKKANYYQSAITMIKKNETAVGILGSPIEDGSIDLGNSENRVEKLKAHLNVNLKGPKSRGNAYISADRPNETDKWDLRRIELTFKSEPNKKLVIYKNETD